MASSKRSVYGRTEVVDELPTTRTTGWSLSEMLRMLVGSSIVGGVIVTPAIGPARLGLSGLALFVRSQPASAGTSSIVRQRRNFVIYLLHRETGGHPNTIDIGRTRDRTVGGTRAASGAARARGVGPRALRKADSHATKPVRTCSKMTCLRAIACQQRHRRSKRPLRVLHVCDHLGWDGSRMHGVKRLFAWMLPRFDRSRFTVSLVSLRRRDVSEETLDDLGRGHHLPGEGEVRSDDAPGAPAGDRSEAGRPPAPARLRRDDVRAPGGRASAPAGRGARAREPDVDPVVSEGRGSRAGAVHRHRHRRVAEHRAVRRSRRGRFRPAVSGWCISARRSKSSASREPRRKSPASARRSAPARTTW